MKAIFLFSSFSMDLKSMVIVILLAFILGMLVMKNNIVFGNVIERRLVGNSTKVFVRLVAVGLTMYFLIQNILPTPISEKRYKRNFQKLDGTETLFSLFPMKNHTVENNKPKGRETVFKDDMTLSKTWSSIGQSKQKLTEIGAYAIQVAAFTDYSNAVLFSKRFKKYNTNLLYDKGLYKVMLEGFTTYLQAKRYQQMERLEGFVREISR